MIDTKAEYEAAVEASPWAETADRTHAFAMGWLAKAVIVDGQPVAAIDDQRGAFEAAFPVPKNTVWVHVNQRYEWNRANNSLTEAMEQNHRWAVWKKCVAVNLGS